jgi:hypothetical protein
VEPICGASLTCLVWFGLVASRNQFDSAGAFPVLAFVNPGPFGVVISAGKAMVFINQAAQKSQ